MAVVVVDPAGLVLRQVGATTGGHQRLDALDGVGPHQDIEVALEVGPGPASKKSLLLVSTWSACPELLPQ